MNDSRSDRTIDLDKPDPVAAGNTTLELAKTVDPSDPTGSSPEVVKSTDFALEKSGPTKVDQTVDLAPQAADKNSTIDVVPSALSPTHATIDLVDAKSVLDAAGKTDGTIVLQPSTPADPGGTIDQEPDPSVKWVGTLDLQPEEETAKGDSKPSSMKVSVFTSKGSAGPSNWPMVAGYQILGELGRGGMGVVYKARQRGLQRLVALKMILSGAHAGAQQLARFNIEAEAVARLQHPNIVQIYEVGEQEGLPYFSLEFVDGGPLDKKLGGVPQPPREAAAMIETLARAMQFAHREGIIHRDLKPANILLTQSGVPKITDFGLAKNIEDADSSQTKSGTIMGTPSYMAPEQARGEIRTVGPLSDLYTLGAILYEYLTGRPPFLGANAMDTVIQVVRTEAIPPSRLQPNTPRDLETICLKCLQKDPAKRYKDCFELAEDLRRYQTGQPILARPVSTAERVWRWCQRNPKAAAATAAIALLLLVISVGSTWAAITIRAEKKIAEENEQLAKTNEKIAQQQRELAEENEQKAKISEKHAEEQAQLSLNTLGLLINKVQSQLGRHPGTDQLKKDLLQTAMDGLKKVTGGASGSMRRNTMDAYFKMGFIARELDTVSSAEAYGYWQQYYDLAQASLKENPDNERLKLEMAWASRLLGEMTQGKGDLRKALGYYQSAFALRQELAAVPFDERMKRNAKLPPEDRLTPRLNILQLSEDSTRIGLIYYFLGDSAQAESPVLKSLELREKLVNEVAANQAAWLMTASPVSTPTVLVTAAGTPIQFDQVNELRQNLARNYHLIGEIYFRLRNLKQSQIYYQKCEAIREAILRGDENDVERLKNLGKPRPPDFRLMNDLSEFHQMYAAMLFALGAPMSDVLPHIDRAIELSRKVLDIDKAVGVRQNLAKSLYTRGAVAARSSDTAVAAKCFQECFDIRQDLSSKDAASYRKQKDLLEVLPRVGRHERVAELAEKLRPEHLKDSEFLISAARCYSQASLAPPKDSPLRLQYTAKALESLQAALDQGYKDLITLETHPDLDPIREAAAFKAILEKMRKPPSTGVAVDTKR